MNLLVENKNKNQPVPIIIDTDIGDDVDDTWAIAFLLSLKHYANIILISTAGKGNHRKRAAIVAQMCQRAQRSEIPIVCGVEDKTEDGREYTEGGRELSQLKWLQDTVDNTLALYPNFIDSVKSGQQIVNTVMQSKNHVTIMAIGPMHNVAAALMIEPGIAKRVNFVSMAGSIYKGYGNSKKPAPEFNIADAVDAAKIVFKAKWNSSYNTPLDTCGTVTLKGYYYDNLLDASNKSSRSLANTVIGNFKVWYENTDILKRFPALKKVINPTRGGRSSTLFDTVAALIAISPAIPELVDKWLVFQNLFIEITDKGMTKIVDFTNLNGQYHNFAVNWKNENSRNEFVQFLSNSLINDGDMSNVKNVVSAKM